MRALILGPVELELLAVFSRLGVRYLVIGGHAVAFHGHQREVKDLDLFVEASPKNAELILSALQELGVAQLELSVAQLSQVKQQVQVGGAFNAELLTSIEGATFEHAFAGSHLASCGSIEVPILGLHHLLALKRRLGRPKDLKDISALEAANAL